MKTQPKYKKGQTVIMLFHLIGLTSEEECTVEKLHKDGSITLDNDYRFDTRTGHCLNDNTFGNASRTLKISDAKIGTKLVAEPIVPHRWRGEDETCGDE